MTSLEPPAASSVRAFATIPNIIEAGRAALDPVVWDFFAGGAETENTLRQNRESLDRITFRPRILVDVGARETGVTLFGRALRIPVFLAPIGSIARVHPDGALVMARVAARMGTLCFVSANAGPELSVIAKEAPGAALVFQV